MTTINLPSEIPYENLRLNLYFIAAQRDLDLIVCASGADDALRHWHVYYEDWSKEDYQPIVHLIEASGKAGPLGWFNVYDGGIVGADEDGN